MFSDIRRPLSMKMKNSTLFLWIIIEYLLLMLSIAESILIPTWKTIITTHSIRDNVEKRNPGLIGTGSDPYLFFESILQNQLFIRNAMFGTLSLNSN